MQPPTTPDRMAAQSGHHATRSSPWTSTPNNPPMGGDRLLPSATELLCATGGRDLLVGISHECDVPPGLALPVLTAATRADGPDSGPVLFHQLLAALQASTVRTERGDLLAALGQVRLPGLPHHGG